MRVLKTATVTCLWAWLRAAQTPGIVITYTGIFGFMSGLALPTRWRFWFRLLSHDHYECSGKLKWMIRNRSVWSKKLFHWTDWNERTHVSVGEFWRPRRINTWWIDAVASREKYYSISWCRRATADAERFSLPVAGRFIILNRQSINTVPAPSTDRRYADLEAISGTFRRKSWRRLQTFDAPIQPLSNRLHNTQTAAAQNL